MERYRPLDSPLMIDRRSFVRGAGACAALTAGGAVLGVPPSWSADDARAAAPARPLTNIEDFMKVPKAKEAIPGPFPGRVVQATDPQWISGDAIDGARVRRMFERGLERLTGRDPAASFRLLLSPSDVVGLKVNPVGPPLINTRHELVDAVIGWLEAGGVPRRNIVIWDRFDTMLRDAGYTAERYPGVRIDALQTMDEEGDGWRRVDGHHVSEERFDLEAFYLAKGVVGSAVRGYQSDEAYLNQHVFSGERSYFGRLVTAELTKIINLPVVKNTGNGISVATKNLGYGAMCNTGRLHEPLFFDVCTEVLAAPWVRDKLVLNVADGLRGQYEGGPMFNAQFLYNHDSLYLASDPFALDMVCHRHVVAKRLEMNIQVNQHPRYTDYLHYGERLGLGIADPARIEHVVVEPA